MIRSFILLLMLVVKVNGDDKQVFTWPKSDFYQNNSKDYSALNGLLLKADDGQIAEIVKFKKKSKLDLLPHAMEWKTRYLIIVGGNEHILESNDIIYSIFLHQRKLTFIIGKKEKNVCLKIDSKSSNESRVNMLPIGYSYANFHGKKEMPIVLMKGLIKKGELVKEKNVIPHRVKIIKIEKYLE